MLACVTGMPIIKLLCVTVCDGGGHRRVCLQGIRLGNVSLLSDIAYVRWV